jgi:hypothetical protein
MYESNFLSSLPASIFYSTEMEGEIGRCKSAFMYEARRHFELFQEIKDERIAIGSY